MKIMELKDIDYEKIITNINSVLEILDNFLLKKGLCSKIKNFFFNDSFGSVNQYKAELMLKFNVDEKNVKTSDNATLNW